MLLSPGDRIEARERSAYVIVGEGRPRSRHIAYPARKVFWNARQAGDVVEIVEATEEEYLSVEVRAPSEAGPGAIERLRFEASEVLGARAVGLPVPIDLIERGPVLVVSAPAGKPLGEVEIAGQRLAEFAGEVNDLFTFWHEKMLLVGPVSAEDFTIEAESGRWTFRGTDRVRRAASDQEVEGDRDVHAAFLEAMLGVPAEPGDTGVLGR
jgi:hypothetical protein